MAANLRTEFREDTFIVIIGCGCVGAYVGSKLAIVFNDSTPTTSPQVYFILNESSSGYKLKKAIEINHGLSIIEPNGNITKISNNSSKERKGDDKDGGSENNYNAIFSMDAKKALKNAHLVIVATKRVANEQVFKLIDEHCCAGIYIVYIANIYMFGLSLSLSFIVFLLVHIIASLSILTRSLCIRFLVCNIYMFIYI